MVDSGEHRKRHHVFVKIAVDTDPSLDMFTSTFDESYELTISTVANLDEPRDNIHVSIA